MDFSEEELNKIRILFKDNNIEFAYFFGSRVKGVANSKSDYDFAIYFSDKVNEHERFERRLKIITKLGGIIKNDNLDLVVLNDVKSVLLKFEIIKDGVVIFEDDHEVRVQFELKSMNFYYDYLPFINAYNEAFIKRSLKE